MSVHMNVQDLAAYVLTIEIQSPLDLILLRSPVMLDIVDSGEQHGIHLLLLFVIYLFYVFHVFNTFMLLMNCIDLYVHSWDIHHLHFYLFFPAL